MSNAFKIEENAGIYYDDVKEWQQKDTSDKTWESFKTFFSREFRESRIQPRTSASEGYGTTTNMRGGHANTTEFERHCTFTYPVYLFLNDRKYASGISVQRTFLHISTQKTQ